MTRIEPLATLDLSRLNVRSRQLFGRSAFRAKNSETVVCSALMLERERACGSFVLTKILQSAAIHGRHESISSKIC